MVKWSGGDGTGGPLKTSPVPAGEEHHAVMDHLGIGLKKGVARVLHFTIKILPSADKVYKSTLDLGQGADANLGSDINTIEK